jgi:hypothetical protein
MHEHVARSSLVARVRAQDPGRPQGQVFVLLAASPLWTSPLPSPLSWTRHGAEPGLAIFSLSTRPSPPAHMTPSTHRVDVDRERSRPCTSAQPSLAWTKLWPCLALTLDTPTPLPSAAAVRPRRSAVRPLRPCRGLGQSREHVHAHATLHLDLTISALLCLAVRPSTACHSPPRTKSTPFLFLVLPADGRPAVLAGVQPRTCKLVACLFPSNHECLSQTRIIPCCLVVRALACWLRTLADLPHGCSAAHVLYVKPDSFTSLHALSLYHLVHKLHNLDAFACMRCCFAR